MRPIRQIIFSFISVILIEMKFINYYFGMMFIIKFTSISNDQVNYGEIIV